jgi:hypothetical protein
MHLGLKPATKIVRRPLEFPGLKFTAMKAEMSEKPEKLVGKYFHSANETNKIEWQGVVIGEPHPGWYLVQLFEWASGDPSVQRLVSIEKMTGWLFYPDADTTTFSSKRSHIKSEKTNQAA